MWVRSVGYVKTVDWTEKGGDNDKMVAVMTIDWL